MKRLLIGLMIFSSITAFANEQTKGERPAPQSLTLTGVVEFAPDRFPSITVDGQNYFLSPNIKAVASYINEGQTVSLKGFVLPKAEPKAHSLKDAKGTNAPKDVKAQKDSRKKEAPNAKGKNKNVVKKGDSCLCGCHCCAKKENAYSKKSKEKKAPAFTQAQKEAFANTPFFVVKEVEVANKTYVLVSPKGGMHK